MVRGLFQLNRSGLGPAKQFREIEFERLVEQLGVFLFPYRHRRVESVEDILHLLAAGDSETAAVLLVEFEHGLAHSVHLGDLPAGVYPELLALPWRQLWTVRGPSFYPFGVADLAHTAER